ncbi:GNAT family N-acetyltransferase [Propioniciclava tarda]|jgi:GNAT superfamily N-acetyltransferase|uniref:N-acetyltransferase n=1 Tax=Propioniciclava tarda TaxID=433330 RepID=A0A4Q9KP02_PROTD|nr:GNAT family N-acetyltransferase [Propioniciclava tarda]TBT96308.1 N-acetyltransferase [Propioniciclava tarda]SMO35190.1 Acetyltransferase (GNAT) domain-containing protein [Propioniciclava tarda]
MMVAQQITVRRHAAGDEPRMQDLAQSILAELPDRQAAARLLADSPDSLPTIMVATAGGVRDLVGAAGRRENRVEFVGVLGDWRRDGVGRRLLSALAEDAAMRGFHALWLECPEDAVAFFEACGFEQSGRRPGHHLVTLRRPC